MKAITIVSALVFASLAACVYRAVPCEDNRPAVPQVNATTLDGQYWGSPFVHADAGDGD